MTAEAAAAVSMAGPPLVFSSVTVTPPSAGVVPPGPGATRSCTLDARSAATSAPKVSPLGVSRPSASTDTASHGVQPAPSVDDRTAKPRAAPAGVSADQCTPMWVSGVDARSTGETRPLPGAPAAPAVKSPGPSVRSSISTLLGGAGVGGYARALRSGDASGYSSAPAVAEPASLKKRRRVRSRRMTAGRIMRPFGSMPAAIHPTARGRAVSTVK